MKIKTLTYDGETFFLKEDMIAWLHELLKSLQMNEPSKQIFTDSLLNLASARGSK